MAKELLKTPKAACRWAKVLKPDGYPAFDESKPNEWSIELLLDPKDPEHMTFLEMAQDQYDPETSGIRKSSYWCPIAECDDEEAKGLMRVRFKNSLRQFRTGTTKPPTVIDSDGAPWDTEKEIGNGSQVRIAFDIYSWKTPQGGGMTFQPKFIQVLEHVPYVSKDVNPFGANEIF